MFRVTRPFFFHRIYHWKNDFCSRLRGISNQYNLIVASYDIVRKDCDFFSSVKWNYCILDEGHIIKNDKTKVKTYFILLGSRLNPVWLIMKIIFQISKAIKRLVANHRLILSGTPIQNNVLELWSLFDFLMPGYLGNEKQFSVKFSKPILSSRDPKSSLKEQEAGNCRFVYNLCYLISLFQFKMLYLQV